VWDEESGQLHRELEGFGDYVAALASFLSPDGQQIRVVAGSYGGHLRMYDPEAGSVLHTLQGHMGVITDLACIASSSAAPRHPRLVSALIGGPALVWDGETGEMLADLGGREGGVVLVAVWKEHTGGHDRIATAGSFMIKVWDGEALTLLHEIGRHGTVRSMLAFQSAEGPARLLVARHERHGLRVWDPEEGRLLHDGINRGCPSDNIHMFESAQGRHLLAVVGSHDHHPRHPGGTMRTFLDVWDLGEAPAPEEQIRPAHKHG
jgi:WD40 repeat protein